MTTDRLGLGLALVSACGLGLAVALSRFAYDGGSNGLTVATLRSLCVLMLMYLCCRLQNRNLRLSRSTWRHSAGLGVLMVMMFYGNIGAVEYISISLTALLFYTFPPMIVLIHALVLREKISALKCLSVLIAFAGIVLMLGVSLESSDWRGIVLALSAALATACNAVWLARKMTHVDTLVLTFHMACIATPILCLALWLSGGPQYPDHMQGWLGGAAVVFLQTLSVPLYFFAIRRVGSLKTAIVSNIQPLVSILFAYLLFGELLSVLQWLGGSMVLLAIILMQREQIRPS